MLQKNPTVSYWILFSAHWLLYFFDQWIKWRQAFFFSGILPVIWKWIDETETGENINITRMLLVVFAIAGIIMVPYIFDRNCFKKLKNLYDTDSIMWFLLGDIPTHPSTFMITIVSFSYWFCRKIGENFYIYLWGISTVFIILNVAVVYIFSFILAPCLFDNSEMPESNLKHEIISMTEKCKHPMAKICLEKHKSKGNHNACVYGFPNNRRMAIFSNLIKRENPVITNSNAQNVEFNNDNIKHNLTINELLGILAHTISFWNSKLPLLILFIGIPYLFICYLLFGQLYHNPYLYETFGFQNSHPILIGCIIPLTVIFPIFNRSIGKFIRTYFRRKSILNADNFAAKYGYSEALSNALIKLEKDKKRKDYFPINDVIYSNYFCPQPTILDRIQRLKKIDNSSQIIQLNEIQSN
uniref:Peptidase M48 domain-containing protein n=1 Tax=Panagrolaimus sp. PS1159 TaxID=55785 RepID=A0AC35GKG5_9BILA